MMNLREFMLRSRLRGPLVFCWIALGFSARVSAQGFPVTPQERRQAQQQGESLATIWSDQLREAEDALRKGQGKKAERKAHLLATDMMDRILFGESAGQWIGTANLLRALGAAQQDKTEDALWYWHVAQQLNPAVAAYDLSTYGPAGELLMANALRPPEFENLPRTDSAEGSGISPPVETFAPFAEFPRAMRDLAMQPEIEVECKVDEAGRVSHPLIVDEEDRPILLYPILDTLRRWQAKPAERDGQPLTVLHRFTVTFRIR